MISDLQGKIEVYQKQTKSYIEVIEKLKGKLKAIPELKNEIKELKRKLSYYIERKNDSQISTGRKHKSVNLYSLVDSIVKNNPNMKNMMRGKKVTAEKKKSKSLAITPKKRYSMNPNMTQQFGERVKDQIKKSFKRSTTIFHGFDSNQKIISNNTSQDLLKSPEKEIKHPRTKRRTHRSGKKKPPEYKLSRRMELEERFMIPQKEKSEEASTEKEFTPKDKYQLRDNYEKYHPSQQYVINQKF